MLGLTFQGVHLSEIGAVWKSNNISLVPDAKSFYEDCPEIDGEFDFSAANIDGHPHYHDRIFEGVLQMKERNLQYLQYGLSKLARWLMGGWGELIFDHMPQVVWWAKIENVDALRYEIGKIGRATVFFRAKPFSDWIYNSQSGSIVLDDPIYLDSDIALDHEFNDTYNFASNEEVSVMNFGDWYTKPVIEITGDFSWMQINCGNRYIRYSGGCGVGDTIKIDCKTCMVTKNESNDSINSTGDFVEFAHGANPVTITSNGSGQAKFIFNYKFIYGAVV